MYGKIVCLLHCLLAEIFDDDPRKIRFVYDEIENRFRFFQAGFDASAFLLILLVYQET